MGKSYNLFAGQNLDRIAALSDGLFAIAMTLLVLNLAIPVAATIHNERELLRALAALSPRLIAYFMSFLTLGLFWIGQHTQLNHFARSNRDLAWIQIAFLLSVSLMPFATDLLADFIAYRTSLIIYWFNLFLMGSLLFASWIYAKRAGLLKPDVTPEIIAATERRIIVAQTLYAAATALSFIPYLSTYWSITVIVLVQLNFAVAPRLGWLYRF
jgi:TMEM175 potassium channel family protein